MSQDNQLGLFDPPATPAAPAAPAAPVPPSLPPSATSDPEGLRPYQRAAVEAVRREFQEVDSTLLVMATGTGKTQCFVSVANGFPGRTLVLAHRDELISQAAIRFERMTGKPTEIEKAESFASPKGDKTVIASVQSLQRQDRLEEFAPDAFGLVIVDEAHHSVSASYRKVLEYFAGAKVLGVTATPDRLDRESLGQLFESVAFQYDLDQAIRDGWLCPIVAKSIRVGTIDLSQVKKIAGDFHQGELDAIMSLEQNLHAVAKPTVELAGDRKTIVFTTSVSNAHRLAEIINRYAIGDGDEEVAMAIDGKTELEQRRNLVNEFRSGRWQYLVNVGIATEGADFPDVGCVVMGRPTQSRALYCLSEDTEILTPDGWKGIGDPEFQFAYSFDSTDGEIRIGQVMGRVERKVLPGERMIGYEGPQVSFSVTDQHRMLWRRVIGRKQIPEEWKIGTAAEMISVCRDSVQLPVASSQDAFGIGASDDELRWLGIVMTDGTIGKQKQITITQSENSPVLEAIESSVRGCGLKYGRVVVDRRGKGNNFEPTAPTVRFTMCYGVPRGRGRGVLHGWSSLRIAGLVGKNWHPGFELLTARELRLLLDGMAIGDGVKNVGKKRFRRWKICSKRKELLDRLQSLCLRRGLHANVLKASPRNMFYLSVTEVTERTIPLAVLGRPLPTVRIPNPDERVWCVETDVGTIITRRNGRAVFMGNCQMLGRGTRGGPACPVPGKTDLLVLDFVGNAGRHSLVSAVDALSGSLSDEIERIANQVLEESDRPMSVAEAVAEAERRHEAARQREFDRIREEQDKRKRQPIKGEVQYAVDFVDPFENLGVRRDFLTEKYGITPATEKQIEGLKKWMKKYGGELPENLSKSEASRLFGEYVKRAKNNLCTYAQMRALQKRGYDAKNYTFDQAHRVLDALSNNYWRPLSESALNVALHGAEDEIPF